jgi:AraC-like DNA-binding protein
MTFEPHNPATSELIGTYPEHDEAENDLTILTINCEQRLVDVPIDMPLLSVLRDVLALTGTKFGGGIAQCGAARHLEQFLPADPTIGQLLRARGAAGAMPEQPARLYLRFLDAAIRTWVAIHTPVADAGSRRTCQRLPKWRLKRVRDCVETHMGESIRLADLAKAAGLSRMQFAATFRAQEGMSPHEYLMTRRIQRAQSLLSDTDAAIVDVALSVGFRNQAHFTTVFRRYTGHTPHRWRVTQCTEGISMTRHFPPCALQVS